MNENKPKEAIAWNNLTNIYTSWKLLRKSIFMVLFSGQYYQSSTIVNLLSYNIYKVSHIRPSSEIDITVKSN